MRRWSRLALAAVAVTAALTPLSATAAEVPDPLAPGPHPVAETGYTLGDDVFHPTSFPGPVELTGQVYYPADSEHGPYPLVVLLHGRHATCYQPGTDQADSSWPCPEGKKPIDSHLGYAALARTLASQGYGVISVSANGINAADSLDSSYGQPARGELVLAHLDLWRKWRDEPGAPVPGSVARSFDLDRIGLMGHSRGGEGVVNAVEQNAQRPQPYRIGALLPLAATDFERRIPTGLPMASLLPACDGDVSDLQGVHYYDDGRYRIAGDRATRHVVTVPGANHNYFNSMWSESAGLPGSMDDWRGEPGSPCAPGQPSRLTEADQLATGNAYMGAFFRYYLGGEDAFAPLWRGAGRLPSGIGAGVQTSYHPPSATARRKDVYRFANPRGGVNDLGGAVTPAGGLTTQPCGGESMETNDSCLRFAQADPQREPHRGWGFLGVQGQRVDWSSTSDSLTNEVPESAGDLRGYAAVQFRAAVDYTSERNPRGQAQDLHLVLTDADGRSAAARAGEFGTGLAYPPTTSDQDVIPHLLLNPVRVPLSAFTGIDLAKVRSVKLAFDVRPTGSLTMADLSFTD
ncbi:alpha/beta hydrolase [Amycolatopsis nigrescens]|uniref:alpha/beta hydrolase n=1 Tax=Amycolatopsis nigrescens TaxID=381445 RepID=UPI00035CD434|nr:alpha/beta hydrolase [Amycolatopsis nigrescens]